MKKNILTRFIFSFIFILISGQSFANDSSLYQKRIEKINLLAEWLLKKPNCYLKEFNSDTLVCWNLYDTAIALFLDRKLLNPTFNVKFSIYTFDYMLNTIPIDSLILRKPNPLSDTLIKPGNNSTYFNNTIIIYMPIYGKEYECFYFRFAPNSDKMIYLIEAGGTKEDYIRKKEFLYNL